MLEKDIVLPTAKDISLAEESGRQLSAYIKSTKEPAIQLIKKGKGNETIMLPASALRLLMIILAQMSHGSDYNAYPCRINNARSGGFIECIKTISCKFIRRWKASL